MYQWNFPKFFDTRHKRNKPMFVHKWLKKFDERGKKYWQHAESGFIQFVKPDSETYLIQAAILGNLAFLETYIRAEGELAIVDHQGRNALHHCVSNGHKQFAILICEFGGSEELIEQKDNMGSTPLFYAVRYNEKSCLEVLLNYEADLFAKKKNGDNCLHEAAAFNSIESMVYLSSFGGMDLLQMKNKQGQRAIDVADVMRNFEVYQVLQKLERNLKIQTALLEREIYNDRQRRGAKK